MTSVEYLQNGVDDQIAWYSRTSGSAQARLKLLRGMEILAAAAASAACAGGRER